MAKVNPKLDPGNVHDSETYPKIRSFPSEFVSPNQKNGRDWCLQYAQAIHYHGERGNAAPYWRRNKNLYVQNRDYAQGKQSIDQYKPMLNMKRQKGKAYRSYRNLNFEILPIGKKFREALKGLLDKVPLATELEAIDPVAVDQKRRTEAAYQEWLINKDFLESVSEGAGAGFSGPMEQGEPEPESMHEIELNMKLFPKQRYVIEMQDVIRLVKEANFYRSVEDEIKEDLVEIGAAAVRIMPDNKGFLKVRRCIPENCISNNYKFKDGRDISYFGEYVETTIAQLKVWAGNQFTEQEYKDIAERATGKTFDVHYSYTAPNYQYPYDEESIIILDTEWPSADKYKHLIKIGEGGRIEKVVKKGYNFPSNAQGESIPISEYEQASGNRVVERDVQNLYTCKWIIGTDYAFDYGLATNMEKQSNNLGETKSSFKTYNLFDSMFRLAKPVLDDIQLSWLQYQHHKNQSRPGGLSIEMSAMENITLGNDRKVLSPKQALEMYFETGMLLWRRKDWGKTGAQWKPIEELDNKMNDGADFFYGKILQNIQLLRDILGFNEVTDASTPNPEVGKAVSEMAQMGTQNALYFLYEAFRSISEDIAKGIVFHIPQIVRNYKHPGLVSALGESTFNFLVRSGELGAHEYSIAIKMGITDEERAQIEKYLEGNLKDNGGMFDADDFAELRKEPNFDRVVPRLRLLKRRKMEQLQAQAQQDAENNKNSQIESAQAAEAAKQETLQMTSELKKDEILVQGQVNMDVDNNRLKGEIILEKVKQGHTLDTAEQAHLHKMLEMNEQGEIDIKVEKAKPKPTLASKNPTAQKKSPAKK